MEIENSQQQPSNTEQELKLLRQVVKGIVDELKLLKIFSIVKQLFEKSYTKHVEKQQAQDKN